MKSLLLAPVAAASILILVAWLGVYNVAASAGHWAIVDAFLHFGMENSVKARASNATPPPLDDAHLVRLGAGHFHGSCAPCHGSPGGRIDSVSSSMLPPPPDLAQRLERWSDQELHWIVKNGIKYTGMPAWPALGRDDEVWALVAFLRRLPTLDAAAYRELALGEANRRPRDAPAIASGAADLDVVKACARCHGVDRAPPSALAPTLHGQPAPMLLSALKAYAARDRDSGVMQPIAMGLSDTMMERLAAYYANLPPLRQNDRAALDPSHIERGRKLAHEGDAAREIPPCVGCHNATSLPSYPRLAGQSKRYLEGQLKAWQAGLNSRTASAIIMAPIARRLNVDELADVSAYFAHLQSNAETAQ